MPVNQSAGASITPEGSERSLAKELELNQLPHFAVCHRNIAKHSDSADPMSKASKYIPELPMGIYFRIQNSKGSPKFELTVPTSIPRVRL